MVLAGRLALLGAGHIGSFRGDDMDLPVVHVLPDLGFGLESHFGGVLWKIVHSLHGRFRLPGFGVRVKKNIDF